MVNDQWAGILFAIPPILTFLFYVIALIFVIVKQSDRPKAKTLATAGVATLILMQFMSFAVRFIAIPFVATEHTILVMASIGLVQSAIHAVAICLFIAAAFSPSARGPKEQTTITGRIPAGNENPYAAPSPQSP